MSDPPVVGSEATAVAVLVGEDETVSVDPVDGGLAFQLAVDVRPLLALSVGFVEDCRALEILRNYVQLGH